MISVNDKRQERERREDEMWHDDEKQFQGNLICQGGFNHYELCFGGFCGCYRAEPHLRKWRLWQWSTHPRVKFDLNGQLLGWESERLRKYCCNHKISQTACELGEREKRSKDFACQISQPHWAENLEWQISSKLMSSAFHLIRSHICAHTTRLKEKATKEEEMDTFN